jgi:serine/threonine protein kinase
MFVFRDYNKGDIYSFFETFEEFFGWREIVDLLWAVASGIYKIHELGLVHGNLHGGNILIESNEAFLDARITDTGLHGPFHKSEEIYGVVPFVAPEIFNGGKPTQASDVYSFGMIMWVISVGIRPYNDRAHDHRLIEDIILGLRPQPAKNTPPIFAQLMKKCLSADPSDRPTSSELYTLMEKWTVAIYDDPEPNDIAEEFDQAEFEVVDDERKYQSTFLHNKAIYYSRNLNSI